jgi:hypothetical protein
VDLFLYLPISYLSFNGIFPSLAVSRFKATSFIPSLPTLRVFHSFSTFSSCGTLFHEQCNLLIGVFLFLCCFGLTVKNTIPQKKQVRKKQPNTTKPPNHHQTTTKPPPHSQFNSCFCFLLLYLQFFFASRHHRQRATTEGVKDRGRRAHLTRRKHEHTKKVNKPQSHHRPTISKYHSAPPPLPPPRYLLPPRPCPIQPSPSTDAPDRPFLA